MFCRGRRASAGRVKYAESDSDGDSESPEGDESEDEIESVGEDASASEGSELWD